jgi:general secretion pathway protein L
MSDTLYLRLSSPEHDSPAEGIVVAADGSLTAAPRSAPLAEFAAAWPECRVIALVPGVEALSTIARLPRMSAAKVARSLPFALEEQIAGDLEGQHFAAGKAVSRNVGSPGGTGLDVPVVVIRRDRLAEWVDGLRAAGLEPAAVHLEDDCVAAKPGDLLLWLRRGEAMLRTPGGDSLVARIEDLADALSLLPAEPPRGTLGLQVFAGAADREQYGGQVAGIASGLARLGWIDAQDSPLPWLVAQMPLARPVNLLQGEFAPRHRGSGGWRRWRIAAALAGMLCVIHVADRVIGWRTALAAEAAIDQRLLQSVRASRPEVQSAADVQRLFGLSSTARSRRSVGAPLVRALGDLSAAGVGSGTLKSIAAMTTPESGQSQGGGSAAGVVLRLEFAAQGAAIEAALRTAGWQVTRDGAAANQDVLLLSRTSAGNTP